MTKLPTVDELTAALGHVRDDPQKVTPRECQLLINVVRASYDDDLEDSFEDLADQYSDSTEDADDLQQDAVLAIAQLPDGRALELVPDLIQFLDEDSQFYELAHALVAIAFQPTSSSSSAVDDVQRKVLAAIIANDDIWTLDGTFAERLKQRGLPQTRDEVERLLS